MLPPDSEAKLDMMLSTMLSYAVYMMILNDDIPPFVQGSSPIIRKYTCTSISKTFAEGEDWIFFILPILYYISIFFTDQVSMDIWARA